MPKGKFPKTANLKTCGKTVDKKMGLKVIPVENLPSTWEGFCIIILSEIRQIRRTLNQIKGILGKKR